MSSLLVDITGTKFPREQMDKGEENLEKEKFLLL
jgi:hypothetical protein